MQVNEEPTRKRKAKTPTEDRKVYGRMSAPPGSIGDRFPRDSDIPNDQAMRRYEQRKRLISTGDQLAESTTWIRNWKWPASDRYYPNDPDMRMVDKYYPYAKGGALLVDEPLTEAKANSCYKKQEILRKMGLRHVVIEPDSGLDHALEQLGEL